MWELGRKASPYRQPIHIWRRREKATSINGIEGFDIGYQRVHTPYYYYYIYLFITGSYVYLWIEP